MLVHPTFSFFASIRAKDSLHAWHFCASSWLAFGRRGLIALLLIPTSAFAQSAESEPPEPESEQSEAATRRSEPESERSEADSPELETEPSEPESERPEARGSEVSTEPTATESISSPASGIEQDAPMASSDALEGAASESREPSQGEGEVIITGTRSSRMAGAVQVIGQRQLERTSYDDPHAVLRQVPGVMVREEDGVGLRPNIAMRGVNPDRSKKVTLMEDGVLFGPAPYSAPAAYYFPLMQRVTQVRVIKGPGAVAFGPQTVAGAVDLVTRSIPTTPAADLDVSLGSYGYRKLHVHAGASTEQFGALIEGVHLGNNGFKELPDDANTGFSRDEWMAKGSYLLDPTAQTSQEFFVKLGYAQEASNETYLGLTDDDFDENPNRRYPASALDRMDNHRTSVSVGYLLRDQARRLELHTTVYRNDFYRSWRKLNHLGGASASDVLSDPYDPENAAYYGVLSGQANTSGSQDTLSIGPNERRFVSQGLQTRFRAEPTTGAFSHKLEVGMRLHYDSIDRKHSESAFAMFDEELYPLDRASVVRTRNRGVSYALALHATDAITWKNLTVTPGVRMEGIYSFLEDELNEDRTNRSVIAVLPGLGIYYALLDDWGVFAGAHRGFSPPPPGSEPAVEPETSVNYELGTRYANKEAKAELIGFFNDYQNLTDVCTFSNGCSNEQLDQQYDAGRASIYGLEALAAVELHAGPVTLPFSASYALSFGTFNRPFQSADPIYGTVAAGDEIPYLPRHQLNAQVAAELWRMDAYVSFSFVSPLREEAGQEALSDALSTDPLYRVDVGLSAEVMRHVSVYGHVRNLLDYQGIMSHRPFGARPNAPRWVQFGVEIEL